MRRRVAPAFSLANALEMEETMDEFFTLLCHQIRTLHAEPGKPINFADWTAWVAADITTAMGFGSALGMTKAASDILGHIKHLRDHGSNLKYVTRLPEITWLIKNVPGLKYIVGPKESDASGLGALMGVIQI